MTGKIEIVGLGPGKHNEDIEGSFHRIMKGASWKKQRIVVILPAAKDIPTKVALSHWSLLFPPNQPVFRIAALGKEVGEAYSDTIKGILAHPELSEWEYILTIEHDNVPPADGLLKLVRQMDAHPEFSCIGGLYWTKGVAGQPQIWGDPSDPVLNFRPQPPKLGELAECCGTGMGFNLCRMSVQTLLAFSDAERERAFHLLAARVAYMMGRKFEEDDWSRVYCAAKGIGCDSHCDGRAGAPRRSASGLGLKPGQSRARAGLLNLRTRRVPRGNDRARSPRPVQVGGGVSPTTVRTRRIGLPARDFGRADALR
jgi:hypothetical protein